LAPDSEVNVLMNNVFTMLITMLSVNVLVVPRGGAATDAIAAAAAPSPRRMVLLLMMTFILLTCPLQPSNGDVNAEAPVDSIIAVTIHNATVTVGREARLSCTVDNL
ncbi:unnamed protein product, partial [Meganyctiphanes norvegica]